MLQNEVLVLLSTEDVRLQQLSLPGGLSHWPAHVVQGRHGQQYIYVFLSFSGLILNNWLS